MHRLRSHLIKIAAGFMGMVIFAACQGKGETSSEITSSRNRNNTKSVVTEASGADSGEKGTIYIVPYAEWFNGNQLTDKKYHYDIISLLVSLQGRLNPVKPTLYVDNNSDSSKFYFNYMRQDKDDVLYGYKKQTLTVVSDFIKTFIEDIKKAGLVVWDHNVPATSNVAFTACGIDGYYPVRYDTSENSLYTLLTKTYGVKVKLDLTGKFTGKGTVWQTSRTSTGSAKCDAYIWAIEKYLDKCDKQYIGCMVDAKNAFKEGKQSPFSYSIAATQLPDADFLIMKKAFFLDLSVWKDESSMDDPTQPAGADYRTLIEILDKTYKKHNGSTFTQVIGVPELFFKYGNDYVEAYGNGIKSRYSNVELEFEWGKILSSYNCVVDGDCGGLFSIFNCSIYAQHKLKDSYKNNKPATLPKYDQNKIYVMFHMGDYDGGAWILDRSVTFWKDVAHGLVPLAWAINPNLSERIPVVFDYVRSNATKNDYFIGGDSGAGYAYPTELMEGYRTHSKLPDALQAWADWNKKYYTRFDLSITGLVHNGASGFLGPELKSYTQFSPDGISGWNIPDNSKSLIDGMPAIGSYLTPIGADTTPAAAVAAMSESFDKGRDPQFYFFRTNLTSPGSMYQIVKALKEKYPQVEVVDPYTFFGLLKQQIS